MYYLFDAMAIESRGIFRSPLNMLQNSPEHVKKTGICRLLGTLITLNELYRSIIVVYFSV